MTIDRVMMIRKNNHFGSTGFLSRKANEILAGSL